MKIVVKDVVDAGGDCDQFQWYWYDKDRDEYHKVKFYNDTCGLDEKFYLCGREFGAEMIVHCYGGESSAYEIWIDELPTIEPDEVHEAYNAFDKLLEYMQSKGYENNEKLRGFCNRWCTFYFEVDTKREDAWDRWELDESYQLQSNSTGTGIVNVGHYEWMREIGPDEVCFERKVSE